MDDEERITIDELQPAVPELEEQPKGKIVIAGGDAMMKDLFRAPNPDIDEDLQTDDLVEVDLETDVVDGPLDDLIEVDDEVWGEVDSPEPEQRPQPRYKRTIKPYRNQSIDTGLRGLQT